MYKLTDCTDWKPRCGDLATVHGPYGVHRLAILWDTTDTTVQYYRDYDWEDLIAYVRGNRDKPYVDWTQTEAYSRWTGNTSETWQQKLAPFPPRTLVGEAKAQFQKIQNELPPRGRRDPLFDHT
jgi:hypothetical protein